MKTAFSLLLLCLLFSACKKEDDPLLRIDGFLLRDNYGQEMGTVGDAGDDWKLSPWSSLGVMEQAFLLFPDTIGVDNTTAATLQPVVAYPNPVSQRSVLHFWAADSVTVKVALVDAAGRVRRSYAWKFKGSHNVAFDVADRALFPQGAALRYYYSFSAAGAPHFQAGYGDIKICEGAAVSNPMNCF